ncbi:replication initiator RepA, partial [Bacillus thuringiensis serovar mexicanensis]
IYYRQVKKESGQANRFYIKEEQLVDSELITLYTSEEYKPVVHYPQIGTDKNVQSVSGQKRPPINNNYLINNKIYSEFLSNSDDFLTLEEAEKIVRKFKGNL